MTRFVLVHRSQTDKRDSSQALYLLPSSDWQVVSYHGKCFKIKKIDNNSIFSFPIQLKIKMGSVYIKVSMKSTVIPLLPGETTFPSAKIIECNG